LKNESDAGLIALAVINLNAGKALGLARSQRPLVRVPHTSLPACGSTDGWPRTAQASKGALPGSFGLWLRHEEAVTT
jgi:hypothetical protein